MTRSGGLRQYRACARCRSRKTRCDLQGVGDPGRPPCLKCQREGANCVLAGSRRGGDYSRFRQRKASISDAHPQRDISVIPHVNIPTTSPSNLSLPSTHHSEHHLHENLQNPSDALLILAHAAGQPGDQSQNGVSIDPRGLRQRVNTSARPGQADLAGREHRRGTTYIYPTSYGDLAEHESSPLYPPLQDGIISVDLISSLLHLYLENYHQFFPIVRKDILDPAYFYESITNESFLLTSILVISSKSRVDLVSTHKGLWDYLRQRILDVVLGASSTRQVGCVEGLLLLGEWNLVNYNQTDDGGGEAAWSILGLAVRLAYRLRLEDSSFRGNDNELDPSAQRNRLAWTFTYLCDRQISIRMGQAFWCRGPGLSARFTAEDFPSLQSQSPNEEDLASWIQAQVELTTLFGNAHDILFASKTRTVELITRGDYVKYIDDTTRALSAWQYAWKSIGVSKHLRSCLTLMQDYLRLYVNAFAFQAVLYRASLIPENGNSTGVASASLDFPNSTMASADARHIYDALDAAESLLKIFIEDFDPVKHLRYMPARFYLYEIHSSVFLFKAHVSGAIPPDRYNQTTTLITRFLTHLKSVTPDETHISTRYACLLHKLWFRPEQSAPESSDEHADPGAHTGLFPYAGSSDINLGVGSGGVNMLEDISLEPFDYMDTVDGFLAMPPVFPYDLSMFFNGAKGSGVGF